MLLSTNPGILRGRPEQQARRSYPILGALLALGYPLGLFLVRCLWLDVAPSPAWIAQELAAFPLVYGYLLISALGAFLVLGYLLGRREDQLRTLSLTDTLTGLPNRRHFQEQLSRELSRAAREHTPLALLVADLDHFKQINDQLGHHAGDKALQEVAQALRKTVRGQDIAARHGGDEFVLLLPGTGLEGALRLAERLSEQLRHGQTFPLPLRLSIGTAAIEGGKADGEALFRAADEALYEAKAAGGGRAIATFAARRTKEPACGIPCLAALP